jgi:hypothetical protein
VVELAPAGCHKLNLFNLRIHELICNLQFSIFNFQFSITGRRALLAAAVFHIALTLTVLGAGRSGIFPQQLDSDGIGRFASDGVLYREQSDFLADVLLRRGVSAWLKEIAPVHARLYSMCFFWLRSILGANILAAEPVNLFCYLSILVLSFALAKEIGGQRAAWIAAAIVGLWPSLLLHTTQLIREPLFIAVTLLLMLVLARWLTREYSWRGGLVSGIVAVAAALLQFMVRLEMRFWIAFVVICVSVLLLIRLISWRAFLAGNIIGVIMLIPLAALLPRMVPAIYAHLRSTAALPEITAISPAEQSLWERIAIRRHVSIEKFGSAGSDIDTEVEFHTRADVIRYLPRAAEIGFFAPFPNMWFVPGAEVGRAGRLLAAAETVLFYFIELLAVVGLWGNRKCLGGWLLILASASGMVGLGLLVVNIGTLYRLRYAFWLLLAVLATSVISARASKRRSGGFACRVQLTTSDETHRPETRDDR